MKFKITHVKNNLFFLEILEIPYIFGPSFFDRWIRFFESTFWSAFIKGCVWYKHVNTSAAKGKDFVRQTPVTIIDDSGFTFESNQTWKTSIVTIKWIKFKFSSSGIEEFERNIWAKGTTSFIWIFSGQKMFYYFISSLIVLSMILLSVDTDTLLEKVRCSEWNF